MGWRDTKAGLDQLDHCLNCGAQIRGKFCPICGQRNDDFRRSIAVLGRELTEDVFSYDSRFYRTLAALLLRPGRLTWDFAEGKRARYMPPIRLYLISTILLFIFLSFSNVALISFDLDIQPGEVVENNQVSMSGISFFKMVKEKAEGAVLITDDMIQNAIGETEGDEKAQGFMQQALQGLNAVAQDPRVANQLVNTWLPRVMILLLPLFAFTLKFFYLFRKEYLLKHAVYSLHFHSAIFLLLCLFVAAQWVAGGRLDGKILILSYVACTAIYSLAGLKSVYRQGWIKTVIKWLALGAAYIMLFFISLGLSIWMNVQFFQAI
ncbi:MAG: DUF3667 domain-containing protein [Sphingomonadales bacterium]|jgi:hypothetical protein